MVVWTRGSASTLIPNRKQMLIDFSYCSQEHSLWKRIVLSAEVLGSHIIIIIMLARINCFLQKMVLRAFLEVDGDIACGPVWF